MFYRKIPIKRVLKQIAPNHSSGIEFRDFMKPYGNYNIEPYSLLVNNAALPSDNPLAFRNNLLKMTVSRKIKAIKNKIEPNKAKYNLHRQTAMIFRICHQKILLTGKAVLQGNNFLEKAAIKKDLKM